MTPDMMNGLFEIGGAAAVAPSIVEIVKHRKVHGISVVTVMFFSLWGYWNMFYYPGLDQFYSTIGAYVLSVVNTAWLVLVVRYKLAP